MYNGPSGPRIFLTITVSSAHAAVAANIAPTTKQIILLALINTAVRSQRSQFSFQESSILSLVTCHSSLSVELTFVLRGVEMAFRFCDKAVIVDFPKFVATDSNFISTAARSGVRPRQRPMEFRSLSVVHDPVHRHEHVRKCCHECLRFLGNRRAPNRRRSVVNAN